jgi:hypothetical protein
MEYQLVLQLPTQTQAEPDQFLTFEDDLIETLEDSADVEGHEPGSSEMNFFITTADPDDTFDRIRPLLEDKALLEIATVAYRHVDEDDYTVLWPEESRDRRLKIA